MFVIFLGILSLIQFKPKYNIKIAMELKYCYLKTFSILQNTFVFNTMSKMLQRRFGNIVYLILKN